MLSRRALPLLVPGALWALYAPRAALGAPRCELFTLARSTNANVVKYAVRVAKGGTLDAANPVEAYWLMLAENGRREDLTWAERQLAYGFSVSAATAQSCTLHLAACSERPVLVSVTNGSYRAQLEIARQPAYLQRVFVQTGSSGLLPSVRYVEISGASASGAQVSERIVPRRMNRLQATRG